jgi:hypothetical protein
MKKFLAAVPLVLSLALGGILQTAFADPILDLHLGFNTISAKLNIVCYSKSAAVEGKSSSDVLPLAYEKGALPEVVYQGLQSLKGGLDSSGVATGTTVALTQGHTSNTVWADLVTPPAGSNGSVGLILKPESGDGSYYVINYQKDSHFVLYNVSADGVTWVPIKYDNFVVPYKPSTQYRLEAQVVNGAITMKVTDPQGKSSTISSTIPNVKYTTGVYLEQGSQIKKVSDTSAVGMDGYAPEVASVLVNGSYTNGYAKDYAVDKDFNTAWNAGGYSGWLQLDFKNPETFSEIQIAAGSSPTTVEDYTISGLKGTVWTQIGTASPTIVAGKVHITPHMDVIDGTYNALKISVNGRASWVAIYEVHLIK